MLFRQFTPGQREKLSQLLKHSGQVAVFDADGTLWSADASESFMQWMEDRNYIQPPEGYTSVLSYYYELMEHDRVASFIWAAQQAVGQSESDLAVWCGESFDTHVRPTVFPELGELIAELHARQWECWIVSASPRWVVEPAARHFNIPAARVLALELAIESGIVVDRLVPPVSSGMGKVERVRKAISVQPRFAAGNSVDDIPLLEEASHMAMVVNPTGLHNPELDLANFAADRRWLVHFPAEGGVV